MLVLFLIAGVVAGYFIGQKMEEKKGGPESRNMEAGTFHKIFQKGGGALLGILALVGGFSGEFTIGSAFGALLIGAYVVYLLWPGYRGFVFFI